LLRGELLRELGRTQEAIVAFESALQAAGSDEQRARAWVSIASVHRVTGEFEPAMQALSHAQPIAERERLWPLCSYIHNMRGNLYFSKGRVEECGQEHQRALDYARQAGDLEREAFAWSGLGDYGYGKGRMVTALHHFRRCIDLYRKLGLVRHEIPNLCMVGHCMAWNGEALAAEQEVRKAVALARRIGLAQIEVMALESIAFTLVTFRGEYDEAIPWIEQAIACARQVGARRYLAIDYLLKAACKRAQGRLDEALQALEESHALCDQIGLEFIGPPTLAARAAAAIDPEERRQYLRQAETWLGQNTFNMAALMFYPIAIDAALDAGECDEALRYAEALSAATQAEPLAFCDLVVARAHAFVALACNGRTPAVLGELTALRDRLREAGIGALGMRVEQALSA
jgi:tetratricopeptide (TPR) repeat protein